MKAVEINKLSKSFGDTEVISNLNLIVSAGSFTVIVGPSGCGKSTLLRIIAGLESVSKGFINIDGEDVTRVPASQRGIAMVFQSYALYPHMTVRKNMSFALRLANTQTAIIDQKVEEAAEILQMQDLLDRKPKELSGGQKQRVAIGRAIVRNPKVFLFDEPLSNLDASLRGQMRNELASLHKRLGATSIYVTHDQVEAMTMADKIVVMNQGVIQQVGSPLDLYKTPNNKFVAGFIGSPTMNFMTGDMIAEYETHTIGIRPEHLSVSTRSGKWEGVISTIENMGSVAYLQVDVPGQGIIVVQVIDMVDLKAGDKIFISPQKDCVHKFDIRGERE